VRQTTVERQMTLCSGRYGRRQQYCRDQPSTFTIDEPQLTIVPLNDRLDDRKAAPGSAGFAVS